jgi:aminoglycoside 2''-phosphotransferase
MEIPASYLDRMRAAFPALSLSTVHLNRDGLMNDVVIVNNEWVFRFAKDEWAKRSLVKEARILALARTFVSVDVPLFEQQEEDMVVYRLIPGDPLQRNTILQLDEPLQNHLAEQIAMFLRQLHNIPHSVLEQQAIPLSDAVRSRDDWLGLFHDIEGELFPLLMTPAKDWVRQHFAPVLEGKLSLDYEPTMIHGDLAAYHLLFNRKMHRLTGVIDFGTAGRGDPATDFALIIAAFGESFLRRMAPFYPQMNHALDRARFWAGTLELQWALGGLRSNDLSWLVCHIGWARDVLPLGKPMGLVMG